MTAVRLALLEFLRFRGPLRVMVPVALAFVPLLYGSLYLWSNWDPYSKLDSIPVAVVDEDRPAEANGRLVDAGAQFSEQLKASDTFDFHFVDSQEAHAGLVDGRYYFTITVPPDFSSRLASAQNPDPQRAGLTVTLNDANNYLVGVLAEAAQTELQNQVNSAAHAAYARTIYGDLSEVKQQLQVASEGVHGLLDATVTAQQGSAALGDGITAARTGSDSVAKGAQNIADAGAQADAAIGRITDATASVLPSAAGTVANTTDAAARTLRAAGFGTAAVDDAAAQAAAAVDRLAAAHPELAADPAFAAVRSSVDSAASAAQNADDAVADAGASADRAASEADELRGHVGEVQQAVQGASGTFHQLTAGVGQIAHGAAQVSTGLDALQSGTRALQTGADQMHQGAQELTGVVDGAVQKIPDTDPAQVAHAADVLGSPVAISTDNLNPAGVYGRGLAPFFFAVALWVVGVLAYLFVKPLNTRALASRLNAVSVAVAGWLPVAAITAVGALILYGVVQVGLGLDPVHPWLMVGFLVLTAGAFIAIDHFLRITLGVIGEGLSLVLLIVQLTACGGLYPIETTPAPFQAVHRVIPMTYVVDGLRVLVSGGQSEVLVRSAGVLAGFLVVFLAGSVWTVRRQRMWNMERLHPQVEV